MFTARPLLCPIMKSLPSLWQQFRIRPGKRVRLDQLDPAWSGDRDLPKKMRKKFAEKYLSQDVSDLDEVQQLLYAANTWAVLVIFQAMDAAGKDSTIKHVMSGLNPQGCQVVAFRHPSATELEHDFLWRCAKELPERGRIGIFNRSYYEEVLIVKVHPDLVRAQNLPDAAPDRKRFWKDRYEDINNFELHLARNGTRILKFFLHVSKKEQRQRLLDRLNEPDKLWKFDPDDVRQREHWGDYMAAYEQMLEKTSTERAPWYAIPADHKWVARALVARILCEEIRDLKLQYPRMNAEQLADCKKARRRLEAEGGTHNASAKRR
jgi:PPK2 family polyphosphate:nucleotide phosphotransferase